MLTIQNDGFSVVCQHKSYHKISIRRSSRSNQNTFKYKKMKNLTSPIQALPINRTSGAVRQANGVSASIVGCHNIGPVKVCAPFAEKTSK